MERILVTGANGFIGRALVARLSSDKFDLTLAVRTALPDAAAQHRYVVVGDISARTDWSQALGGCRTVVHLAGVIPRRGVSEERFRVVNDEATASLVEQAHKSGVRRFVLLSSLAAITDNACPDIVSDMQAPRPVSAYGRSKLAAERHVTAFAGEGREGVSLRPPMVYAGTAGGSWALLQKLAASRLPLPFGAVRNRRAALSLDNLTDAVATVVGTKEPVAGGAFIVADEDPVGLAEMLLLLRQGMGLAPRLFPVPRPLLSGPLRMVAPRLAKSLLDDLVVDAGAFRDTFGWTPPEDVHEAMRRSGADYAAARRRR